MVVSGPVFSVFVLPGEVLAIEAVGIDHSKYIDSIIKDGELVKRSFNKWRWKAPQYHGCSILSFKEPVSGYTITLNAFIMIPYNQVSGEYLNGYRIGKYPGWKLTNKALYKPPKGFVEVTKANEDLFLSPHFRLKQFLCKQKSSYPKYIVLKESLLYKLELLLAEVNSRGYTCSTFHIMSGYRTPHYNDTIGNVKYSRHLWGDAADIFIDENPVDNMMDDLNRDGDINLQDAAVICDIIENMTDRSEYQPVIGGMAKYKTTNSHGPYVHIDARGIRARW